MTAKEDSKNTVARKNNFGSFAKAMRYTFNRELLQSENEFINKIIDEAMEEYAELKAKEAFEAGQKKKLEKYKWGKGKVEFVYETYEDYKTQNK